MSLLDKASLIITPNAYKESKLYSVIPSNGDGDMTVVRATTATRVNEAGLIEVVPKNLLTYSEEFDNASWVKDGVSLTTNATISPNGTTTADLITESATLGSHRVYKIISIFGNGSFSFFVKSNGVQWIAIAAGNTSSFGVYSFFDIINGTLGVSTIGTSKIEDYGNGWYRCSVNGIGNGGGTSGNIYLAESNGVNSYTGNGVDGIYIWGAQLEAGSTATSYFPTTDRLNIPRIDYTGGGCPSILVEPQRTNLLTYSEDFSQSSWSKVRVNVTSQSLLNPKGELSVNKIESNNSAESFIERLINFTSSTSQVFSYFAKKGNANFTHITFYDGVSNGCRQWFDLENGVLGTSTSFGSGITIGGANIEDFGNGWCKVSVTSSTPSITSLTSRINISETNGVTASAVGSYIYTTMAQFEIGSYLTSYIPTVASSVTRNADVISKTGISDLIGVDQGTFVFDIKSYFQDPGVGQFNWAFLEDGIKRLNFYDAGVYTTINGSFQFITALPNGLIPFKVVYRWNTSFISIFINGVKIIDFAKTATFNPTVFAPTSQSTISKQVYNKIIGFNTSLTDTECINLTTL